MRRRTMYLVLSMSLLCVIAVLAGAGGTDTNATKESATAVSPEATPPASSDTDTSCSHPPTVESVVEELQAQAMGGVPPCPETHTCAGGTFKCVGNAPCRTGLVGVPVDTGWRECMDGEDVFTCQHGTIHISTSSCVQCPCCTAQPYACVCPQDCGYNQTWTCS